MRPRAQPFPFCESEQATPGAEFIAPMGIAVSIVSLLLVAWLLTNSTLVQARDAGIAAAIGLLIYFVSRRKSAVSQ